MANPLFHNNRGEDANRASNPLNDADKTYRQKSNSFSLDRKHFTTLNYADITPFEHVYAIGGDSIEFGSRHHLRTYTLASPLMEKIFIKKSYYATDMRALLPINWEKIYREPSVGDDIPNDSLNTFTDSFIDKFFLFYDKLKLNLESNPDLFSLYYRWLVLLGDLFGSSGLLSRFSISLGGYIQDIPIEDYLGSDNYFSFDTYYELLISRLLELFVDCPDAVYLKDNLSGSQYLFNDSNVHDLYELSRDFSRFSITGVDVEFISSSDFFTGVQNLVSYLYDYGAFSASFNYAPLIAYQLVCAEYFTNDQVDNIYSSQLWHQNMRGILSRLNLNDTFLYNGVPTLYDSVSAYSLEKVMSKASSIDLSQGLQVGYSEIFDDIFGYVENIFCMNKSLRYGDYFTGARPEAYSPIDKTAEVVDGSVSAIDITRSILSQRFSNAVARTGRRFSDYLVEITDGYDVPDVEVPRWLASKTSEVKGFEVENTSNTNQGNIVTILNSKNSDFIYKLDVGSPCIVIGVATFSMSRVYPLTNDRFSFHKDRYDMFNKFMQFDGDQEIYAKELLARYDDDFAYTLRHMEYKQRYNIATGGWKDFIPAMFLLSSRSYYLDESNRSTIHIDSFNIRNSNLEFDPFYSSISGFTPSARFHFMAMFDNIAQAKRKMARQPSIL